MKPIRVSQLNAYIARLIASDSVLSDIAVVGEISNFKLHGSGHVFFSLIDDQSRVDCFLPSGIFINVGFDLRDGIRVNAEGYMNVYEKGGRYSLTIRRIEAEGRGDLSRAFEQLKQKLMAKGYFDEARKKPLPVFPLAIAIVTSNTGAAVSDMKKIITDRNKTADILIFPTLVQGDGAAEMIASRIRHVNESYPDVDVIIVGRGGGSQEDLAAFNEEIVADAIFASRIPVVSAVGHETDFTIADFVADRRAETPTAAAVMAAPDTEELSAELETFFSQTKNALYGILSRYELYLRANNLSALVRRLKVGVSERGMHTAALRALIKNAAHTKAEYKTELNGVHALIRQRVQGMVDRASYRAQSQEGKLETLDPMSVLARGYTVVEDIKGRAVTRAETLKAGQQVSVRFSDGSVTAAVEEITRLCGADRIG